MKFPTALHDPDAVNTPMPAETAAPAPRRRNAALLLVVALVTAGLTALAVSSAYESRSLGQRLDDSLSQVQAWGTQVQQQVTHTADAAASSSTQAVAAVDQAVEDAAIHARITTALLADPALQPARMDVDVQAGHVRLRGVAPTEADKERAGSLARATPGVRAVDNQLRPASTTMSASAN